MAKRTQPGEILGNPLPFRGHSKCQNQVGTELGELDKEKAGLRSWSEVSKAGRRGGRSGRSGSRAQATAVVQAIAGGGGLF